MRRIRSRRCTVRSERRAPGTWSRLIHPCGSKGFGVTAAKEPRRADSLEPTGLRGRVTGRGSEGGNDRWWQPVRRLFRPPVSPGLNLGGPDRGLGQGLERQGCGGEICQGNGGRLADLPGLVIERIQEVGHLPSSAAPTQGHRRLQADGLVLIMERGCQGISLAGCPQPAQGHRTAGPPLALIGL